MNSTATLRSLLVGAAFLPVLLAQTGCLSSRRDMERLRADNAAGDFETGVVHARDWVGLRADLELGDQTRLDESGLLAAMEYGQMQLNAGKYQEAQNTFDWTQRKWSDLWNNPSRDEGVAGTGARKAAQVTLPPYSAHAHEGMMLYTYLGLNDWIVGDKDAARGHFASALEPRQQANMRIDEQVAKQEAAYREKAESQERKALQDEAAKTKGVVAADGGIGALTTQLRQKVDASIADSVAQQQSAYGWAAEGAEPSELEKYRNYENPLLSYLYFLTLAVHGSGETDYNDARNEANRLAVMIADKNKTVCDDIVKLGLSTERNWPLDLGKGVYVFFETGMAPRWTERKISIPIPSVYLSYVGIALPELLQNHDCIPALSIADAAGGSEKLTAPLLNMDALVVQDFRNRYKGIVASEAADAVILAIQNATINYLAKVAADQSKDQTEQLLIRIGGAIVAGAASAGRTFCDTRSWEILPKLVQVTRVDRPADGSLKLAYPSGGWSGTVPLIEGDLTVVWVKSTSATQINPAIHQFKLK